MAQTQPTQSKLKPLPSAVSSAKRPTTAITTLEQAGTEPQKDQRRNTSLQDHVGVGIEFLGKSSETKRAHLVSQGWAASYLLIKTSFSFLNNFSMQISRDWHRSANPCPGSHQSLLPLSSPDRSTHSPSTGAASTYFPMMLTKILRTAFYCLQETGGACSPLRK